MWHWGDRPLAQTSRHLLRPCEYASGVDVAAVAASAASAAAAAAAAAAAVADLSVFEAAAEMSCNEGVAPAPPAAAGLRSL